MPEEKDTAEKGTKKREFQFTPRIINPVKITRAVIFAADEYVRAAGRSLAESMPWIEVETLSNPFAVSNYRSERPSVILFDDTALNIADTGKIRQLNADAVLVLLSLNEFIHCSPPSVAREKFPYTAKADLIFAFNRTEFAAERIMSSVVRSAEDLINIKKYSRVRRYVFLIVDDEPRWFSQFLPVLYNIIGQRADVMITRTYEETLKFLFDVEDESKISEMDYISSGHGDDVVCLISDIFFPKGDRVSSDAGKDLINLVNRYYPRIPIIIASKAQEVTQFKDVGFLLPKGDPGSLETLRSYIRDFTGIGAFIIHSRTGKELFRIRDIQEMLDLLFEAEKDTPEAEELRELLESYGEKDKFSTWLYMHSFRELGDKLRPKRHRGHALVAVLKRNIKREILRTNFTPLIVNGMKSYNLRDLLHVLRTTDPDQIQEFTDNDIFSSWLDRKGYSELAEELRPIHGSGNRLVQALIEHLEKWIEIYERRSNR